MSFPAKSQRSIVVYLIALWMIVNVILMLTLLPEDYMDLNNWIELGLWIPSIFALFSMKKLGAAFVTFTLIYTLSTSVSILIYYQVWLNAIRIVINSALIIYMFKSIFAHKFR